MVLAVVAGCGDSNQTADGGRGGNGGTTIAGSGGTGGGAGTGAAPMINCGDVNQPIDPTAVIDDMEAPDYMTVRAGGRSGAWWAGGDA